MITQSQYQTSRQNIQTRFVKLDLLNYQYQTVGSLEGVATSGSISIDANADIRRSGSLSLVITNSAVELVPGLSGNAVWLDKYIRVYVGIANIQLVNIEKQINTTVVNYEALTAIPFVNAYVGENVKVVSDSNYNGETTYYRCTAKTNNDVTWSYLGQQIEWTNCGMYIIDAPSYSFDPSTNTLSLSLLDLMAKLTGARNGYLPGVPISLKAGENIREAIIDTLALGGFTKYVVDEAPAPGTIPVDLEFNQGTTVYDILSALRDIYPDYEIFFDVEGTFYYKPIPDGVGDPIVVDDDLWDKIVLSEQLNTNFQEVKNSIAVYGRTHDPAHFATNVVISGVNITLTIPSVSAYVTDEIYGFTLKDNTGITAPYLRIGSLTNYPIQMDDGSSATILAETGEVVFCVQFKGTYWRWLGHLQAYGFAEDTKTDSPFYVNGPIGKISLPLFGGDYDNCMTDNLAQQRADYELWMHTNMNNTVSLSIIPCYWLDVNILVEYTLKRNNITAQYLIKSLNFGLSPSDSGSINMIQFYSNPAET